MLLILSSVIWIFIMWLLLHSKAQLNCVKQFLLVQTIKYIMNTEGLRNGSCYMKEKKEKEKFPM